MTKMRNQEKKDEFAKYLFDLARLNQSMLKGAELTAFINRSIDFMK
jgi:molecular chaperone HtpG